MNRLDVDQAAEVAYQKIVETYSKKILARADLIARGRIGDSIQTGDLELAETHVLKKDSTTQMALLLAGGAVGAGIAGIAQSLLDHKPLAESLFFGAFLTVGAAIGAIALWRK